MSLCKIARKVKPVFSVILVILASCLSGCHAGNEGRSPAPVARQGVIDLTSWDFAGNGSVALNGEWEFYWHQLLSPDDFNGQQAPPGPAYLALPASWNGVLHKGETLGGAGFATFRLRILPGAEQQELALHLDDVYSAYRLWADGKLLVEYGVVGRGTAAETPSQAFRQPRLTITGPRPVDLVLQISNHHYREGGAVSSIKLGPVDELAAAQARQWGLTLFCIGSLLVMGIYHFTLFCFRRKDIAPLYFGMLCTVFVGSFLYYNGVIRLFYDNIPVWSINRLDMICFVLVMPCSYGFNRALFPDEFHQNIVKIVWVVASLFSALGIAAPTMTFTSSLPAFYVMASLFVVHGTAMLAVAIWKKREGSIFIFLGFLVAGLTTINDMLFDLQLVRSANLLEVGILFFTLAQACALSLRFSKAFTTVEHLSTERNAHIQTLSRMDRLKDEFLANTSHELRTPLNGIIGLAESLGAGAAGPLSEEVRANLEMISGSGRRLNTLVNDILDLSRLKNRDLQLHRKAVDLWSITDKVLTVTAPLVRGRQLRMVNAVPADLPLVDGDEDRLQQILFNLVGNAVKFTDQGEVVVGGTSTKSEVEIFVRDTGIGIPEASLATIFNAFEQVDGTAARNHGGVGLGLGISRRLVELHGGRLWAESSPDAGATFRFTLPLASQAAAAVAVEAKDPALAPTFKQTPSLHALFSPSYSQGVGKDPNAPRILAVDDDPVNLQVVCNHLGLAGMVVTVAASGPEALALIESGKVFDLVLLDVMMPGMTGFAVCRGIRRRYNPAELPVLMLTAKNRLTELTEGLSSGANDYIGKPFAREELLARVNAQLKVRKAHEMTLENSRLRREIEVRAQTELELRLGQRRMDGLLHALPEPMIAINDSREIAFCNRVFTERFGYRADDLLGRSAQALFAASAEPLEAWLAALAEPETTLPATGLTLELTAADGRPWSGRVVPTALELENERLLVLLLAEPQAVTTSLGWIDDLSQNRRRLQQLEETLNGLTPLVLAQHPGFIDDLRAVDMSLAEMSDKLTLDAASGPDLRQLIVEAMQLALDLWTEATLASKADLARRSGQWAVYVNQDGWERTQSLDRYLTVQTLPAKPRLKKVLLTCEFVLAHAPVDSPLRRRFMSLLSQMRVLH